jgi:hypothetical protein
MTQTRPPPDDPTDAWYKDASGRCRNDVLGLWLACDSYRDGTICKFLRADESGDADGVAKFATFSDGRELDEAERATEPGIDYEIIVQVNAANRYPNLPEGLDHRALIKAAILAQRGHPALYRMGEDRNYYARTRVEFVSRLPTF